MNKTKKVLIGLGIIILGVATGMTGDYYLIPSEKLLDQNYTKYEYGQIRNEMVGIALLNSTKNPMTFQQFQAYWALVNNEVKKCGGKMYNIGIVKDEKGNPVFNSVEERSYLNKYIIEGCPK